MIPTTTCKCGFCLAYLERLEREAEWSRDHFKREKPDETTARKHFERHRRYANDPTKERRKVARYCTKYRSTEKGKAKRRAIMRRYYQKYPERVHACLLQFMERNDNLERYKGSRFEALYWRLKPRAVVHPDGEATDIFTLISEDHSNPLFRIIQSEARRSVNKKKKRIMRLH